MARFDKLEFGSAPKKGPKETVKLREEKDQKYWAQMADEQRRTGKYENALRFYSRTLEMDKAMVSAWVGQVQMLIQLREYPQASLWSQKALEIFPGNSELMAGQAQAESRMGNLKKALALSDAALAQRGESAYKWQVRGDLMVASKQTTDRTCFDKAQIASSDWLVPLESAWIYCYHKVFSKAQQRAQVAAEKAPDSYYAWYTLGLCQSKLGFESSARSSLERCLELCPRHADAHKQLGELQQTQWPFSRMIRRLLGG